jgi:uncharacterized protein
LLEVRERRIQPGRDEKILSSWNGLAIGALAIAARTLERPDLARAAASALDFIGTHLWRNRRLFAVCTAGEVRYAAYLDDYAFVLDAVLELLQARWRSADLTFAIDIASALLAHFEDRDNGGFFFTADDHEVLMHRAKSFADDATPAGNALAARALARLGLILGETRYLDAAARSIRAAWSGLVQYPHGHAAMLIALEEHLEPPSVVIIRGTAPAAESWRAELARTYSPSRIVLAIPDDADGLPEGLSQKSARDGTVAYVCRGLTCSEPIRSLEALTGLVG